MNASLLSSEDGIGSAVQGSGMGLPTLQERGIGDAQQFLRQDMMSSGSPNLRGFDTSGSDSVMRDVGEGMGEGLNNVMRMTENIQSKYGDPNDRTVDQIMSQYNVDNAENAFQGMDNNRGLLQRAGDALVPDFYQKGSGFTNNLNRAFGGSDVTDSQIYNHLNVDKPYNNQTIVNNAISDATDGYHIRSGKDYGSMTKGDLPLGGLPATLGALAYQQVDGIADSSLFDVGTPIMDTFNNKTNNTRASWNDIPGQLKEAGQFISSIPSGFETALKNPFGTFGTNAFLQSADNIEGLRQSGNAPLLDKAYEIGQRIKTPSLSDFVPSGLLDRPPNEDAIRIAKQKEAGTFQPGKKAQAYEDKPVAVVKPRVKVDYNKNTPAPTQKKQSRAGAGAVKAPTRTTGSRGRRGNVGAKKSAAKKTTKTTQRYRPGGR